MNYTHLIAQFRSWMRWLVFSLLRGKGAWWLRLLIILVATVITSWLLFTYVWQPLYGDEGVPATTSAREVTLNVERLQSVLRNRTLRIATQPIALDSAAHEVFPYP